jgi:hypothetical protein
MTPAASVDPRVVPQRLLHTGANMPAIGLGTFGSDHVSAAEIAAAVEGAISVGYRHIDCASVYGNEDRIGAVLRSAIRGGVPREELWITSKLWNDKHAEADVIPAFRKSLADLQLDYLDLYLIHWPFPNFHPPGCSVQSHDADVHTPVHAVDEWLLKEDREPRSSRSAPLHALQFCSHPPDAARDASDGSRNFRSRVVVSGNCGARREAPTRRGGIKPNPNNAVKRGKARFTVGPPAKRLGCTQTIPEECAHMLVAF